MRGLKRMRGRRLRLTRRLRVIIVCSFPVPHLFLLGMSSCVYICVFRLGEEGMRRRDLAVKAEDTLFLSLYSANRGASLVPYYGSSATWIPHLHECAP